MDKTEMVQYANTERAISDTKHLFYIMFCDVNYKTR